MNLFLSNASQLAMNYHDYASYSREDHPVSYPNIQVVEEREDCQDDTRGPATG
jgi:hypothetical protein